MRIGQLIYLDYQATTPMDPAVISAMEPYFRVNFGNPHSTDHIAGWTAQQAIDDAAASVAKLIGADSDEIIFTSGATEANNLSILGFAARAAKGRSRILVSAVEHKSILSSACVAAERYGLKLETIPVTGDGRIDPDAFAAQLKEDVLSVSVMAVNNEVGAIQPLKEIGRLCANYGAIFHSDAAQAPLAIDLNVQELNIGSLSLSAHKIYGPKGIGAAYIRRDLQSKIEPLIYGGGQQLNLRSGTLPTPLCVGFGAAVAALQFKSETQRITDLRNDLERGLLSLGNFVQLNGCGKNRHPGNLNVRFEGYSAEDILASVQPKLAASTGSACTSGITEPSHVLKAMGLTTDQAKSSIRFGLGRFTIKDDIEIAVALIREAISRIAVAA